MINYDSKNWYQGIVHFKKSYIIRRTLRAVLISGIYAALWVFCENFFSIEVHVDSLIYSLLGIFLSLLMAFRSRTAYDRYWEGRKQWGALINHTRTLAVMINNILGDKGESQRRFFATTISAYAYALSDHLRDYENHDLIMLYSNESQSQIEKIQHVPNKIVNDMFQRVNNLYQDGFIDGFQLTIIKPQIQALLDIQGACERIKSTPIPYSYNFFIKLFISVYVLFLPAVLIENLAYWSVPMTMLVAYAMVGLEFISVEIEEPFGMDCNDLATTQYASKIEKGSHEILRVNLMTAMKEQASGNYMVIH